MGYTLTYSQLVAEVQTIVESDNDEFVQNLPKIIARAHDQVQRDLDLEMWRDIAPKTIATNGIVAREDTWLKVLSIYAAGDFLSRRSLDYIRACGLAQGVPKYWSDLSETQIKVTPMPTEATNCDVEVLKRLPSLSESNPSSWISKNAADLLLLQTLIGSEVFLVGGERVAEFAALYKILVSSAIDELRGSGRREYEPVREAAKPNLEKTT